MAHFLRRGAAAAATLKEAAQRDSDRQKSKRFWLKPGGVAKITFLDGTLDNFGTLDCPLQYEHEVKLGNRGSDRAFIPCTEMAPEGMQEICPLCASGNDRYLVGFFTVVDHTGYEKDGKKYTNLIRLFAAKKNTITTLTSLAQDRGGIKGYTVKVVRSESDSKAPRVGSVFDFLGKVDLSKLHEALKITGPLNYDDLSTALTADQIRQRFHLGSDHVGAGAESSGGIPGGAALPDSFDDDLPF